MKQNGDGVYGFVREEGRGREAIELRKKERKKKRREEASKVRNEEGYRRVVWGKTSRQTDRLNLGTD